MLKAIIVDDESSVRYAIRQQGDWQGTGITIIAEAENGLQAYELALMLKPDLIITDMKMPGMDGSALMAEVRKKHENMKFIVVSGYDDYQYMKSAISSRVVDYILKPIDEIQLNEALYKAAGEISEEDNRKDKEFKKDIELIKAKQFEREKLMNKIINESFVLKGLERQCIKEIAELDGQAEFIIIICRITNIEVINEKVFNKDSDVLDFGILRILEETLEEHPCVTFKNKATGFEYCVAMAICDSYRRESISFIKSALDNVINNLYSFARINCVIGVSSPKYSLQSISACYKEAARAILKLNFFSDDRIDFFNLEKNGTQKDIRGFSQYEKEFIAAIESCDEARLRSIINKVFNIIGKQYTTVEMVRVLSAELISCAYRVLQKLDCDSIYAELETFDLERLINVLLENRLNQETMADNFCKLLQPYFKEMCIAKRTNSKKTLYIIRDYIENYCCEEMSLETLAQKHHLSSGYLCRLFKEEFGVNLTDFIINTRVHKAKDLIMQGNVSISEAMRLSGFNNSNYFGKVFKKFFGITPSECKAEKRDLL